MKTIVTLDEASHTYTDNYGRSYLSVSKFIELFFKKFDKDNISIRTAIKNNMSQAQVIAEWDKKRDDAIVHGNNIHNALESYMKTTLVNDSSLLPLCKSVATEYSQYYRTFQEEIIFNEDFLLAGTTDNRFQHTSSKNSIISFGDYKTNLSKGIEFENKYGQYMLEPLSHLQDCNFTKYSLQLSIYAYMYQLATNCKIGSLHIMFIPPDNFLNWKKIYIPYLKYEVEAMVNWYINNPVAVPITNKSALFQSPIDDFDIM
tara:strand:+ start:86 stop:862 length:777 start_codon:yes stop_codon:yes gene_type:complete